MALRLISKLGTSLVQETMLSGKLAPVINLQHVRYRRTKHWNPKFKQLRRLKVIKVELPKYNEKWEDLTEEEVRSKLKEQGLLPPRPWMERQFHISCTGGVFEPYIPPEGDGKVSPITAQGAKQKLQYLEKKSKTMMAVRKIRSFDEDFDTPEFCKLAESIYIKTHELLAAKEKYAIRECITERAYPEVMHNVRDKTLHWKFLKTIELPRVVHARCTDVITKDNIFAQLTVRFHTQQVLAIYDRFGRLMHGSEIIAKDVLEYVVFEKHLSNEYGVWRVHDKIIPDWVPAKAPSIMTYKKEPPADTPPETKEVIAKDATKELPAGATSEVTK